MDRTTRILFSVAALLWAFAIGLVLGREMTQAACVQVDFPPVVVDEPAPVEEAYPPYTDEELELLALVIYQEAGADYCSDDTRLKVGTVVMNRVESDAYPDTLREVVLQPAQYGLLSVTGPVWPDRAKLPQEAHAVKRAYDCAEQVLLGHRALPADTVYQAEFVQGSAVVAYQDEIYFCKE